MSGNQEFFNAGLRAVTTTLTTDDNTTQNDGAREVTFALALNSSFLYTLGTTSSVTVEVRDNDTPPTVPRNLMAEARLTEVDLTWQAPATDHGQPLTYEYRQKEGTGPFGDWTAILNSDIDTTDYTVTGLTMGTDYTFEVRAENVGGKGNEASVMVTTLAPEWEFTLTDSNGNAVTEFTEGGDPATVTVRITNGVTFTTAQTVTLEWDASALDAVSPIQGSGGASEITIPPGTSSGTLVISAPDPGGVAAYTPPRSASVLGRHGATRIGGLVLTFRDDEDPPVATLTAQPAQVSEGEGIEIEVRLSLPYGGNATSTLQLIVTDAAGALVAPLPTGAEFDPGELTDAITLTAADNAVHNDARVVTVALAPSPDASLYTLGAPSSATVVVTDNDNSAPVFSDGASATRSVAENTAAGENVGAALTATDADAGDTLTYTLEGADAASFDIVSTSGQIRTRPGVTYDHEARSSYSVTVKADDGNAGTATIAVTITVTDVAEPPAAPGAPTVTATSASTTSLDVTWTAPANPGKPAISGYDLRYRAGITGSWTDGPQNRTGASASIASLTAGTSYQVQVRATNAEGDGPWSASGTGSTGTSSNAAPTFANPTATRSVPENTAAGENVGAALTATDTDAGDTLTYTLEGADAASFDIVSTSGQIRTRSGVTYDHEARSSYSVTVKAGTATVTATWPAAPGRHGDLRKHHEPGCDLDRAGQHGQAGHQRLRPALPGGHQRELDRRPAEPDRRQRQHREPDRRHLLPGAGARHQRRGRRPLVRLGHREHRHLEQHRPGCAAVADRGRREPGGDAEVACAGVERRQRDPAISVPATVRVPSLWQLDGHRGQCSGRGQCEQLHRDGAARQCPVPIRGAGGEHRRPGRGIERGRRNTGASHKAPCVAESVDGPVRPNRGDPGRGRDRGPVLGRRDAGGDGWRAEPQPDRGSR